MISMRPLLSLAAAAFLSACMATGPVSTPATQVAPQSASAIASETYLLGWGMFADPVFDRDVITFERAFARAFGTPAQTATYGANDRALTQTDIGSISATIGQMAGAARDGQDVVVVMLTSHGAPNVMALQTRRGGPAAAFEAAQLAQLLAPLQNDLQIIILQACFSGSLIDDLRSPNRTAAAADRSSFGCNPESDNTWFIKSLNRALGQGGSWRQIFARTQALVSADEAPAGFPPSNPQSYVGANMRGIWTQNAN